jgi:hypothetical protein
MRSTAEWARAYLEQAHSDWLTYQALSQTALPQRHALHSLQMTLEKLGKSLRLADGGLRVEDRKRSHLAFVKYVQAAKNDHRLQDYLRMRRPQFRAFCDSIRRVADGIERLQRSPAGAKLLKFVDCCFRYHGSTRAARG